jgi:O-antigen ligase
MILTICGIAAFLYMIATNPTVMARWQLAQKGDLSTRQLAIPPALGMISERPMFGWGPMEFMSELGSRVIRRGFRNTADTHNLLFNMLLEVGVVGTMPFFVDSGYISGHGA